MQAVLSKNFRTVPYRQQGNQVDWLTVDKLKQLLYRLGGAVGSWLNLWQSKAEHDLPVFSIHFFGRS